MSVCDSLSVGSLSDSLLGSVAADGDLTSSTATGRNSRLQTLRDCNSIMCGNAWETPPPPPATLTTTKVQCEGCSTRCVVNCSSSDGDNWKCSTCSMYWSFKI